MTLLVLCYFALFTDFTEFLFLLHVYLRWPGRSILLHLKSIFYHITLCNQKPQKILIYISKNNDQNWQIPIKNLPNYRFCCYSLKKVFTILVPSFPQTVLGSLFRVFKFPNVSVMKDSLGNVLIYFYWCCQKFLLRLLC